MQQKDYFVILILMFMNLTVMAFFTTAQMAMSLPLAFLIVLIIIDTLYVFGTAKKTYAFLFFGFSFAAMAGLLLQKNEAVYFLIAVIDLLILYYIHAFVDRMSPVQQALKAADEEAGPAEDEHSQDEEGELPRQYDESLFTQLGYPTLQEISKAKSSVVYDKDDYPVLKEVLPKHDEDYPTLEVPEEKPKKEHQKKGYVHIDSLNLPNPKPKKEPSARFKPTIYYDEPRASFNFTSIDEVEDRLARARIFTPSRPAMRVQKRVAPKKEYPIPKKSLLPVKRSPSARPARKRR